MIGRRVMEWPEGDPLAPGEYAKHQRLGTWYACSPNDHLANLAKHVVTEHDDGTITVSPSIGIGNKFDDQGRPLNNLFHGYLERGVWTILSQ